ncbi:MAG TPA: protein translocase subunit SecD [Candidatus Limnocylindria bacterium]|nr:protein translocase subunit SecD [Candidatus Limnocylindria bacterium]
MTWRRIAPWVILITLLLAIFIDIPRELLPSSLPGNDLKTTLGLDLQGGVRVTLAVEPLPGQSVTDDQLETARTIIERRVGGIGVSEPLVRSEISNDGQRRIVVEVPGVENEDQVRELVGSTGQLQFIDPQGQALTEGQDISDLIADGTVSVIFDGGQIDPSSVAPSSQNGQLGVSFSLRDEGSQAWCEYTTQHNEQVAPEGSPDSQGPIALDGEIITNPGVQEAICGGQTVITVGAGEGAEAERTNLYNTLRFGALPVSLQEQGFDRVEPTLGANFLNQALVAGGIGLLLVLFFMIAYYRLPGVLAAGALIFYTLVTYAIFRLIGVTLTLAGVAAFILSIGMAVDANILIFERMKEEIRAGKTLVPAIEAGFNRAWSSILDSNVSSILVASWLYWQGTTAVRGFALVLIIGVAVSMFSAVTVTRTMLRYVVRTDWGRRLELYHVER